MPRSFAPLLLLGALSLTACGSLDRAVAVATGFVSHQVCSATFVSGVDPEPFYREAIAPTLSPVGFLASHQVDRGRAQVRASFAGLGQRRLTDQPCDLRHRSMVVRASRRLRRVMRVPVIVMMVSMIVIVVMMVVR